MRTDVAEVNNVTSTENAFDTPAPPSWVSPGGTPHVAQMLGSRVVYEWPARVFSRPGDAVEVCLEAGFTVALAPMSGRARWPVDRNGTAVAPGSPPSPMSAAARPLVQVNQSRIVYRGPGEVDAVTARALVKALEAAADALDS